MCGFFFNSVFYCIEKPTAKKTGDRANFQFLLAVFSKSFGIVQCSVPNSALFDFGKTMKMSEPTRPAGID